MSFNNILFILTIITAVSATKKTYDGYSLYKIIPKDDNEVRVLKEMQTQNFGEFFEETFKINDNVKVMIAPENSEWFTSHLKRNNIEATVTIQDIQKAIDQQIYSNFTRSSESYLSYTWSAYYDLDAIYQWLDELQVNHGNVAKTVVIGKSVENRDIKGIIINHRPERRNPLIGVLEGTLHAREWISAATLTWVIKEFLTSTDPAIRALAETFEWHIFPVVNPDGYAYTFTHNRMWRKNRSKESSKTCDEGTDDDMSNGVDLNRNFDFHWGTFGTSPDSCVNTYPGPVAFSEPEARAIAQYMIALKEKGELVYYIAFHSYTQLMVVPYSHLQSQDSLQSGNYGDMFEIAQKAADAVHKRYGTNYRVGLSANVMYAMSGTSFDWVKSAIQVPITYLFELRDLGEFGFLLPANQIVPTALETMDGLVEMDRVTRSMGYYSPRSGASGVLFSSSIVLLGLLVALFM